MPKCCQLINPLLEENITLVVRLVRSELGYQPGILSPYAVYPLTDDEGNPEYYSLTYSVLQFKETGSTTTSSRLRLDITEPTREAEGSFGEIYPVFKSIIFNQRGNPVFDDTGQHVVKKIKLDTRNVSDKPSRPNAGVRSARREHYQASVSELGVHYDLIETPTGFYMHMDRVPGLSVNHYYRKLSLQDFLALSCALLEETIKHLNYLIPSGKHQGKGRVHCDLKPDNIHAVNEAGKWRVKFLDWGRAKAKKGGEYSTSSVRGSLINFDLDMFNARSKNVPIIYNAQTETYAVFTVILLLAGSNYRYELESELEFYQELEQPCLDGLFVAMDIDDDTKSTLKHLIARMISRDRNQRPSAQQALHEFKSLLHNLPSNTKEHKTVMQAGNTAPSLTDLIKTMEGHVRQDLEEQIEAQNTSEEANAIVLVWIKKYRHLSAQICALDARQLDKLLSKELVATLNSQHIYDYLRFNLLHEYDALSSARLLIRHHSLIHRIKGVQSTMPDAWIIQFNRFFDEIPLQITADQKASCFEIANYKNNIQIISREDLSNDVLFDKPRETIQAHLNMEFRLWLKDLPELAEEFNVQFRCFLKLRTLLQKVNGIEGVSGTIVANLADWANGVSEQVFQRQSAKNPSECIRSGKQFVFWFCTLNKLKNLYTDQFKLFPSLTHCLNHIQHMACGVKIENEQEVNSFSELTKRFKMLIETQGLLLKSKSGTDYPVTHYQDKLQNIITRKTALLCMNTDSDSLIHNLKLLISSYETMIQCLAIESMDHVIEGLIRIMTDETLSITCAPVFLNTNYGLSFFLHLADNLATILDADFEEGCTRRITAEVELFCIDPVGYAMVKDNELFVDNPNRLFVRSKNASSNHNGVQRLTSPYYQ